MNQQETVEATHIPEMPKIPKVLDQIPEQPTPASRRCRHRSPEDHRCGSPSMRNESFCYHHHQTRRPVENLRFRRARQATFSLAVPNSRVEIQNALGEIMLRIASNNIDIRRAGLLLYALQTANSNLTHHQSHNAQPKPALQAAQVEEESAQSKHPQSHPEPEQQCHPGRSVGAPGELARWGGAESEDLRLEPQPEPTPPRVHYGSGATPDLTRSEPEPAPRSVDFTPPPPVWRRLSKATGAALLENLARSEGAEPIDASCEDRVLAASTRAATPQPDPSAPPASPEADRRSPQPWPEFRTPPA